MYEIEMKDVYSCENTTFKVVLSVIPRIGETIIDRKEKAWIVEHVFYKEDDPYFGNSQTKISMNVHASL